jgi:DNA-binding transcriptional LysR family regulator
MKCSTAKVSRAVAMLEDRLHARLVHRTTRSLSLTEPGQRYYERCKQILSDLDSAEAEAGDAHRLPRGTLHVHCSPELGLRQFTESVVEYQRCHPHVNVHVRFVPGSARLIEDRVDVSIVSASSLPNSGSVSKVIGEIEHVLVAEPAYLASRRIDTFNQLAEHALTEIPERISSAERDAGLGILAPASSATQPRVVIDDAEATRFAVLAGAGVAALPLHVVSDDIKRGALVRIFPGHRLKRTRVFALYASRCHVDAKIRTFVDFAASHFGSALDVDPPSTVEPAENCASRLGPHSGDRAARACVR